MFAYVVWNMLGGKPSLNHHLFCVVCSANVLCYLGGNLYNDFNEFLQAFHVQEVCICVIVSTTNSSGLEGLGIHLL